MTREEFENIYRQHYAKMYRLARTMLYDVDESKDVVPTVGMKCSHRGNKVFSPSATQNK